MTGDETTMGETKKKDGKQKWLILLLLLVILVLAFLLIRQLLTPKETAAPSYEREVAAKLGQLDGKSEAEIQAELNRVIEEGMFHISINTTPVFADGSAEGNLEIENVPGNRYLMRVEIKLDDTGETVYSTKFMEPNTHIQRAALDTRLEKGEYPATATFYAYDQDTLAEMGSVSGALTLIIRN
jgi:cytoskeletal protein RodZ